MFEPSPYQQAIFEWIENPNPAKKCLIVEAVAGSGKTTTITKAASYIPANSWLLFVAFGKRNVEDLKPRLPHNAEARTMNSLGNRVWTEVNNGERVQIEENKTFKVIEEFFVPWSRKRPKSLHLKPETVVALMAEYDAVFPGSDRQERAEYQEGLTRNQYGMLDDLTRLIGFAKGAGLAPYDFATPEGLTGLMDDTRENWKGLIESNMLDIVRTDIAISLGRMILRRSIELGNKMIDYDDQLYLPIIFGAKFPIYPWIFVDECQDLNAIQHAIIKRCMGPDTRVVFVGDSRQAIMAFRGSLTNSMDIIRQEFDADQLPLSICYRCEKAIVQHAQEIVPHIEYHPSKTGGRIVYHKGFKPSVFGPMDVVICRNTRPLVSLAYDLIACGVSVRILGRDIEHGLVKIVKRMKAETIDELRDRLDEYEDREVARLLKKRQPGKAGSLSDRIRTVRVFIEELGENNRTIDGLIASINKLFDMERIKNRQMLTLCTVHKSKGGEWENVFVLNPNLMPSPYAITEEQLLQEQNLIYVARTRAINQLHYISGEDLIIPDHIKEKRAA